MRIRIGKISALAATFVVVAAVSVAQEGADEASPVARAVVCTDVLEREPVGEATSFDSAVERLFCFTEIRGQEGKTITHAWIHEGTTRARVDLPVRSARWRTWSSKKISPGWKGQWQVKVLDADGVVLSTLDFVVE